MVGQAVEHNAAGLAGKVWRDGKQCPVRQRAEQPRMVRQTVECRLVARLPIDQDIRLYQVAKHQLDRQGTGSAPAQAGDDALTGPKVRSEERRVGKECRSRWSPYHYKK